MSDKNFKIGFSDIGGIFIGKDIKSAFHSHYAISILISLGETFKITTTDKQQYFSKAVVVQKNTNYSLLSSKNDFIAFIHIVPYSKAGIRLSDSNCTIRQLEIKRLGGVIKKIMDWFNSSDNDSQMVAHLLEEISMITGTHNNKVVIDQRIMKSFNLIMHSDIEKFSVSIVATKIHLSVSHFNRLFKKETGLTFRKFVLHSKLIKAIFAMYKQNNLTQASFIGGFSDQPHFTRTFKNNFGIKPSASLK